VTEIQLPESMRPPLAAKLVTGGAWRCLIQIRSRAASRPARTMQAEIEQGRLAAVKLWRRDLCGRWASCIGGERSSIGRRTSLVNFGGDSRLIPSAACCGGSLHPIPSGSRQPDMRIRRDLAVLSHDRTLHDVGRCDQ
jgi:hypothetical protein